MQNAVNGIAGEIIVPRAALPFVLHQRPMLQASNRLARRLGIPLRHKIAVECFLRRRAIGRAYERLILEEYESVRAYLPESAEAILDIGCGVAGIDVLLLRHYQPSPVTIFLLDKTDSVEEPRYGFGSREEFYNSLEIARGLLAANGIDATDVHLLTASPQLRLPSGQFDLVVSLASWGFHYPVHTYLEEVCSALRPGGRIILDIRANVGEEQVLRDRFERVEPVCEMWEGKAHRYCLQEPRPKGLVIPA